MMPTVTNAVIERTLTPRMSFGRVIAFVWVVALAAGIMSVILAVAKAGATAVAVRSHTGIVPVPEL